MKKKRNDGTLCLPLNFNNVTTYILSVYLLKIGPEREREDTHKIEFSWLNEKIK